VRFTRVCSYVLMYVCSCMLVYAEVRQFMRTSGTVCQFMRTSGLGYADVCSCTLLAR
jgi:hypothetical protein